MRSLPQHSRLLPRPVSSGGTFSRVGWVLIEVLMAVVLLWLMAGLPGVRPL